MLLEDQLPNVDRLVRFVQGSERLGQSHERVAVVVLLVFAANAFEERTSFLRAFEAQEALAKVRTDIDVLRVALNGGPIARFSFVEFAALEINIAELKVMVS